MLDSDKIMQKKALTILKTWNRYAKKDFYIHPDKENLQSYGTGYGGWAVQTNQKVFASYAMEGAISGNMEAIETALKLLRFSLESHIEGSMKCFDGRKWGHTWISTLGIERMMHAVYPIMKYMTDEDKKLLRKVLVSEADWLLYELPVTACLYDDEHTNKPEANAWNGAFLFRVASMYPDTVNAAKYKEKAEIFLFNSISIPEDSNEALFVGSNFFESMALNHHCYLNVGYMVITLSQIAMLHFYCKEEGIEPPKNLYHNTDKLWKLVKSLLTPDGRLIRIGGDTRVRYCYCQDYAIPMWLFAQEYLKDADAKAFLQGWIEQVEKEVSYNGDGSFLSTRCYKLHEPSPIYYTRLESDRACSLSMILAWLELIDKKVTVKKERFEIIRQWQDEYHGAVFVQDEQNIRSWTWRGDGGPVGLCLPKSDSSFAEWDKNMVGEAEGIGRIHDYSLKWHKESVFNHGFVTMGALDITGRCFLAEQQSIDYVAEEQIACAALPDDATMIVLQLAQNPDEVCSIIRKIKGLNLKVPNDLFNGCSREYFYETEHVTKECMPVKQEESDIGSWLNVDNKLGIYHLYGKEKLKLYRSTKRMGEIADHVIPRADYTGSLYCDVVYTEHEAGDIRLWKKTPLIDTGFVVTSDTAENTAARSKVTLENKIISTNNELVRCTGVLGRDGEQYVFVVNFSENPAAIQMKTDSRKWIDLCTGAEQEMQFLMKSKEYRLFAAL